MRLGVLMVGAALVATASACPAYGGPSIPGDDDETSAGGAGGAGGVDDQFTCEYLCPQMVAPPCREGVCDANGNCRMVPLPAGTPCDDGKFCTLDTVCDDAGSCIVSANDCGLTPAECEAVVCDEARESCSLEPIDRCP